MHLNKYMAFTLVELAITVLVLSILITLALPYYHQLKANQERSLVFRLISDNIQLAKQQAVINHSNVVICSTQDQKNCKDSMWNQGFIVFLDTNQNRKIDNNELLISTESTNLKYGNLNWRGTLQLTSLNFKAEHGLPIGSNGSFYYCSISTVAHIRIIMSKMGHLRTENPTNC
ncbi:fimbrial biogenesis protein FimT [Acinetobacter tandoii]|uniref:GspH/FimT family pseudopilin n=1 Tax=Acinetobacter tandoii TaxID=202954 RepID=UPI000C206361|nr:GspH/FimT family pseudopilin [Acinetobacter tandoii]PJG43146.1 fimbrial biogenesis protein FimT [Acinetobacter tandoii]